MNTKDKTKIVVFGLDACDVDLMLRWSKEGRMPFLTSLMESNTFGRLISTKGWFSDSPWPSINTGVSPAKHTFYNYLQLKRGTIDIERINAHHCRYLPYWSQLRGTGMKVAALDVPKTFPIEGLNGVQLSAWSEHYPLLRTPTSMPPDFAGEIIQRYGAYPHPDEVIIPKSVAEERKLYRMMCSNLDNKSRLDEDVMRREDWDLFISVFSEVHYAGHQFYHHFEKSHWAHQVDAPPDFARMLPDLYTQLDAALAKQFQHISDQTTFFIVSVHGFATNYSANHMMPTVLEKYLSV
jgi:predicted AlkP superfamily phosphohydrolase/phosphomutase